MRFHAGIFSQHQRIDLTYRHALRHAVAQHSPATSSSAGNWLLLSALNKFKYFLVISSKNIHKQSLICIWRERDNALMFFHRIAVRHTSNIVTNNPSSLIALWAIAQDLPFLRQ